MNLLQILILMFCAFTFLNTVLLHIKINAHQKMAYDEKGNLKADIIIFKLIEVMNRQERLQQLTEDLNTGTNELAADLQKLKDEIAAGNVSDESLDNLASAIDVLKQLGNAQ